MPAVYAGPTPVPAPLARSRPGGRPSPWLARCLVDLDRVAIRILDLDLLAAGPDLDFVAEARAGSAQPVDQIGEIVDVEHDPVPAAGLLSPAVWHAPRARAPRPAQQKVQRSARHRREYSARALVELEPQVSGIERDRAIDVGGLVADDGIARLHNRDPWGRGGCGVLGHAASNGEREPGDEPGAKRPVRHADSVGSAVARRLEGFYPSAFEQGSVVDLGVLARPEERHRRHAGELAEVVDEVRLIEVPAGHRHTPPVLRPGAPCKGGCTLEPQHATQPLGRHADL